MHLEEGYEVGRDGESFGKWKSSDTRGLIVPSQGLCLADSFRMNHLPVHPRLDISRRLLSPYIVSAFAHCLCIVDLVHCRHCEAQIPSDANQEVIMESMTDEMTSTETNCYESGKCLCNVSINMMAAEMRVTTLIKVDEMVEGRLDCVIGEDIEACHLLHCFVR